MAGIGGVIQGLDAPPYFIQGDLQQVREQMANDGGGIPAYENPNSRVL